MTIGVPPHQDQAANMSNDSLEHTDPHYFNLNVNFHLSGNDSEGSGAADELRNAWTGQFGLSARWVEGGAIAYANVPSSMDKPQVAGLENPS